MAIRSGDIQSTWYRVEETGRLKTLGKALPSTGNEKGNKINKITICNLNSCDRGVLVSIAFITGATADSTTDPIGTDKGFYIYYKKSLALNDTLIIDRHYFDEIARFKESDGSYNVEDLQIAIRLELHPEGKACSISATNPGVDVHITK